MSFQETDLLINSGHGLPDNLPSLQRHAFGRIHLPVFPHENVH
jgi:hypothetical protein